MSLVKDVQRHFGWGDFSHVPKNIRRSGLYVSRIEIQGSLDYWNRRVSMGDFLLDEWMVDAHKACREGIAALDKMEATGAYTGKDYVNVPQYEDA